jgi:nitrous oxidase accessory protein NosD
MDKGYGILIVSVTILVLCFVGPASATNCSVDGSGGEDFTGIQDAINNAKEGDTIFVYSGVYHENVVVDKSVTLKGIDHPVVDANGSDSAITLTADGITLVGFTVANSYACRIYCSKLRKNVVTE